MSPRTSPELRENALEQLFQRRVRLALGGMCIKLAPTIKGLPDRLVLLPGGKVRLVELKTTHGRTSPSQDHLHSVIRNLGIECDVLYGADDVFDWIAARAEEGYHERRRGPGRPRKEQEA